MDKIDILILEILQKDARTSASDISKKVKLSVPSVSERIKKLNKKIINSYAAILNHNFVFNVTGTWCLQRIAASWGARQSFLYFSGPRLSHAGSALLEPRVTIFMIQGSPGSAKSAPGNPNSIFAEC